MLLPACRYKSVSGLRKLQLRTSWHKGCTGGPRESMARGVSRRVFRRFRESNGTSLIEAAVLTPLLLLLTFSIVDFASVFYVYLALENGASQATRFAVTGNQVDDPANPGTPLSRDASIMLAMRQATPTLTIGDGAFTFSHMSTGGSTWASGTGGPGDIEKLSISYTWNIMTPLIRPFFTNGQITLNVESAMKNESRFN